MLFDYTLLGLLSIRAAAAALDFSKLDVSADSNCTMPATYTITGFQTYVDSADSSKNTTSFSFTDSGTGIINTRCQHNVSSVPDVPQTGLTPRWLCDNRAAEFIYQNSELTVIETVCPEQNTSHPYEASGAITFNLTCSTEGTGTTCRSAQQSYTANFDALDPRPSNGA